MTPKSRLNLPLPTLGGKQLWADRLHYQQWRIQQNVLTGHCRLLDPRNVRRAWGSYDACVAALDDAKRRLRLPRPSGDVVIVLHGLARSRGAMSRMARYLREEAGYDVYNVSYPSTRATIAEHAANLASIVSGLAGATRVHFVGHSLGNIVVRHYLADRARAGDDRRLPAIGRAVMLAPPNQGAEIARRLARLGVLHVLLGNPLTQFGRDWKQIEDHLATPPEFGIIAGGRGRAKGLNPLLTGDDDLIVSVEETRLPGAAGFLVLPVLHALIMNSRRAQEQTAFFLRHGRFDETV